MLVELHDVLDKKPSIKVELSTEGIRHTLGISVADQHDQDLLLVENHDGKLTVHIWATPESVGVSPTHKIEIKRG